MARIAHLSDLHFGAHDPRLVEAAGRLGAALVKEAVRAAQQQARGDVRDVVDTEHDPGDGDQHRHADRHGEQQPPPAGDEGEQHDGHRYLPDLYQQGVQGLVLDLRGNGGGLLTEAVLLST